MANGTPWPPRVDPRGRRPRCRGAGRRGAEQGVLFGEASLAHETVRTPRAVENLAGAERELARSVRTRNAAMFTRTHSGRAWQVAADMRTVVPVAHVVGGRVDPTDSGGGARSIIHIDSDRFDTDATVGLDEFSTWRSCRPPRGRAALSGPGHGEHLRIHGIGELIWERKRWTNPPRQVERLGRQTALAAQPADPTTQEISAGAAPP
jgi:hypothetical protein